MDADAMASPLGAWASIRGYFTPATLFLLLNMVIGTIALTSRSRDQRRRRELHHHDYAHLHDPQHGHHYPVPTIPEQHHEYGHYYQNQEYATPPPPPAPLARTSSMLDRIRSIGLYRFRSGDFPPEYGSDTVPTHHHDAFAPVEEETTAKEYARSRSEQAPAREERISRAAPPRTVKKSGAEVVRKKSQATRALPATRVVEAVAKDDEAVLDARAEEFIVAGLRQQEPASPPRKAEHLPYQEEEAEYVPPPAPMRAPPPLSRTSSVLDRLRSIGLYNFLGTADQPAAAPTSDAFAAAPVTDKKQPPAPAPAHYDRSRSEPARQPASNKKEKTKPAAAEGKMAKSSSSTPRKASPSLVSQPSVNTRAEAFIDSFRKGQSQKQQLQHRDEDDDEHVAPPPPAPLARTSSVLDRLRSFSLYLRPGDPAVPEDPYKTPSATDEKAAPQYARSRSEPARDQVGKKKKAQQGISKTSSETNIAEEESAEECVDARADDFINKFRQQLQLQRLNSLLSYGKQ